MLSHLPTALLVGLTHLLEQCEKLRHLFYIYPVILIMHILLF